MSRVFTNGLEDRDSIPGQVIPKTQKTVLDAALLNPQHYKVWIKGEVEHPRNGVVPSSSPQCIAIEREPLCHLRLRSPTFFFFT